MIKVFDINTTLYLFFFLLIIGTSIIAISYRQCKILKLNPPIPILQPDQFAFFFFLREKSQIKEYRSLKKYYWSIILTQLLCGMVFFAMLIEINS